MITHSSRYLSGLIRTDPGSQTVMVNRRFPFGPTGTVDHIWSDADRLDLLASRFLGNGEYWWKILDLNPFITDPSAIRPGTVLRMP